MGIDYKGVAVYGVKLDGDHLPLLAMDLGTGNESDYPETLAEGISTRFGLSYATVGSLYSGEVEYIFGVGLPLVESYTLNERPGDMRRLAALSNACRAGGLPYEVRWHLGALIY